MTARDLASGTENAKAPVHWTRRVFLILVSLALSLAAAECLVRLSVPVRNVGPSFTRFDPVYGKRLKTDFTCRRDTPEFTMHFRTNRLGFRGSQPTGELRNVILFVGDSFTLGYGVSDGQEFPALIEAALVERHGPGPGAASVINAGIGDSGNGHWVKFLRDQAAQYEPRLVVLQVTGNDFGDNLREGLFDLSPDGELAERPVKQAGWARRAQAVIEAVPGLSYSHLIGLLRQALTPQPAAAPLHKTAAAHEPAAWSGAEKLTFALIERSLGLCRQNRWPTILVAVEIPAAQNEELHRRCAAFDTPVLEVPRKKTKPDLYFQTDGHWNADGHAIVAQMLMAHIETLAVFETRVARPKRERPDAPPTPP